MGRVWTVCIAAVILWTAAPATCLPSSALARPGEVRNIATAALKASDVSSGWHEVETLFTRYTTLGLMHAANGVDYQCPINVPPWNTSLGEMFYRSRGAESIVVCGFLYARDATAHAGFKEQLRTTMVTASPSNLPIGDERRIQNPVLLTAGVPSLGTEVAALFRHGNSLIYFVYTWRSHPLVSFARFKQLAKTIDSRLK